MKHLRLLLLLLFPLTLCAQNNVTNIVIGQKFSVGTNISNLPSGGGGGPPCVASYANTGGTGDRTAIIAVTVSSTAIISAGQQKTVDGDTTNPGQYFFNDVSLNGSQWVKWDFGVGNSVLITEAKYFQENATSQGVWKWQGSPDDSSWTDIGSSFTLGGTATETITTLSANITEYRYYRILSVSGTSSSNPWGYEMEFKICGMP